MTLSDPRPDRGCGRCGAALEAGQRFCGNCGAPVEPSECSRCGGATGPDDRFCGSCGLRLAAAAPPASGRERDRGRRPAGTVFALLLLFAALALVRYRDGVLLRPVVEFVRDALGGP